MDKLKKSPKNLWFPVPGIKLSGKQIPCSSGLNCVFLTLYHKLFGAVTDCPRAPTGDSGPGISWAGAKGALSLQVVAE